MTEFDAKAYWESRLGRHYDLAGVGCLGFAHSYNRWLYAVKWHGLRRLVRHVGLDLGDKDVLDVGSGTGFFVDCWRRLGARSVAGADLTDVAVDRLRAKFPDGAFHRVDIGDPAPGLPDRTFDVVSSFDVLYHIVDDERYARAFANMHRALAPGGWLVISDHFLHGPAQRSAHVVSRPLADVRRILDGLGFEGVTRRPENVIMDSPVDANGAAVRALWRVVSRLAMRGETWGRLVGAALYPLERLLTTLCTESPSVEFLVCRKPRRGAGAATT